MFDLVPRKTGFPDQAMFIKFLKLDGWTKMVLLLLCGIVFLGKASQYLALGLGGLLVFSTRLLWDPWYRALTQRVQPLNEFAWPLLISLIYGGGQLIYGILLGYSVQTAFQILIFNICPVYLFLGIWVGFVHPTLVRKYIRYIAWYVTFYAPLYFLFLNKLGQSSGDGDSGLGIFGNPGSGSIALLGLLAYEPDLLKFWAPILVLTGLTIANQERADWLGLGVALMIWGKLSGRIGRVFSVFGVVALFLIVGAIIDLRLPPIPGRGGELSARGTLGRMAGAVSPEFAGAITGEHNDASFYYGTVYWRKRWWAAIREEVSKDPQTMTFGLGYGYPLAKLAGNKGTEHEGTRSPHSIFYFALAYSGVVGVVIFFWLEICVIRLLYRVYKVTGQIFGLGFFAYNFVGAFFGNFLETPSAINFYLILGLCVGPMLLQLELEKGAEYAELGAPVEVAEVV